jgi:hypothetical protein
LASLIREVFGVHVPDRARKLEKMLKQSKRRWGSLTKYIVPKLAARPPPSFYEITPMNVLTKLRKFHTPEISTLWPSLTNQFRKEDKDKSNRKGSRKDKDEDEDQSEARRGGTGRFSSSRRDQPGY